MKSEPKTDWKQRFGLPDELPPVSDLASWRGYILSQDTHPFFQFVKYGVAGGMAFVVDYGLFWIFESFFFPVAKGDEGRSFNFYLASAPGFFLANLVAYLLNVRFVFRAGKHKKHIETILFLAVSFVSAVLGLALGAWLVGAYPNLNAYVAKLGGIVTSVLINYVCRKFVIFHG